ncbi:MAG: TIGR03546 family protein [Planctomycetaceae bacterium]|nr:TIGR03546 family protein [Planctomycetaceae bacterium]
MLELIWAGIGGIVGLFLKETKPHHVALGVALGVMLGLVPKANLIALVLVAALFLLRCNLGFGILAAALVSLATSRFDAIADPLGARLLAKPAVLDLEATLIQYPLFAWTDMNNTLVLGSFVSGAVAFLPVYLVVYVFCWMILPKKKAVNSPQK